MKGLGDQEKLQPDRGGHQICSRMCLCYICRTLKPSNVKLECSEDSEASVLGVFTPVFRAADFDVIRPPKTDFSAKC